MGLFAKKKSEVFITFTHFLQMAETQYNTTVCHLRSDNGHEYVCNEFCSELAKWGILQTFTCPYIPEQNGVAQRKNGSLMSIVRCLLRGMNAPKHF